VFEAIDDLTVGQPVPVAIQRRLGEDVHAELRLVGVVRVTCDGFLATVIARVVVPVVLGDVDGLRLRGLLDEAGGDLIGVTERVTTAVTRFDREVLGVVWFGRRAKSWVMTWFAVNRSAVSSETVFVFIVRLVGRRLGPRALFARGRVWVLVPGDAVDFLVVRIDSLFEFLNTFFEYYQGSVRSCLEKSNRSIRRLFPRE